MSPVIRPTWLSFTLLLALTSFAASCGDDSEIITQELDCMVDGFEGGDYSFTVSVAEINDECAGGIFNGLVDPGPYPTVALPATADLPQDITMTFPYVGDVTGTLSSAGGALHLSVDEPIEGIPIQIPNFGTFTVTASVSGTLCPVSETRVDAAFFVTVQSIQPSVPLVNPPCRISVPATGTLQ